MTQNKLNFDKQFIVRAPLFSIQEKNLDGNLLFKEAIKIASDNFHQFLNSKESKILLSKEKYKNRIRHKCIPFGLFAHNSVANWIVDESTIIVKHELLKRNCRIDSTIQNSLITKFITNYNLFKDIRYFLNNTIIENPQAISYIDYNNLGKQIFYMNTKISKEEFIKDIIDFVSDKLFFGKEILKFIELSGYEDSEDILLYCIKNKILIPETEINCVGMEQLDIFLKVLEHIEKDEILLNIYEDLIFIKESVNIINSQYGELKPDEIILYDAIKDKIFKYLEKDNYTDYIHVDSYFDHNIGGLNVNEQKSLQDAFDVLLKLNRNNDVLKNFKNAFSELYGDRFVPISEVVDLNNMLSRYLGGEAFKKNNIIPKSLSSNFINNNLILDDVDSFLFNKLINSVKAGSKEIVLDEINTAELKSQNVNSNSISIFFRNFKENNISKNFVSGIGLSPDKMIGRFSNYNKDVSNILKRISANDSAIGGNEVIYAEIIHIPSASRLNNVMYRKHERDHEIVFVSYGSDKTKIYLSDLYIGIKNDRIKLFSKKLEKEIIPVMANAHNTEYYTLPLYRLLNYINYESVGNNLNFSWGNLKRFFNYFPRVVYKNVILSLQTWEVDLKNQILNEENINEIKNKYLLPDEVLVSYKGSDEVYFNLLNYYDKLNFISFCKNKSSITIKEYIFNKDNETPIKDLTDNGYANEFLAIAFLEKTNQYSGSIDKKFLNLSNYKFGEEWIYVKIYIDEFISDSYLIELVSDIKSELLNQDLIDFFFFIRYYDSLPHIRLRLKLNKKNNNHYSKILDLLNKKRNTDKEIILPKMEYSVYKPEYLRYGIDRIDELEKLFFIDSMLVVNFIARQKELRSRIILSMKWSLYILEFLNFSYNEKIKIINNNKEGLKAEHNVDINSKKDLNKLFKEINFNVLNILDNTLIPEASNADIGNKLSQIVGVLEGLQFEDQYEKASVFSSIFHMHVNRLFNKDQRTFEFIIYDFLDKFLKKQYYLKNNK